MQVYISDIFLVSSLKGRESYVLVNFAGSDFKYPYFKNKEIFEFHPIYLKKLHTCWIN